MNEIVLHKQALFFIIILFLFFLLRFPSLFEPYWYGDEGIYQVVAKSMLDGRILYQEIWDNKPPVLYILYSLTNADQFTTRLLFTIIGAGAVAVFFFLSKELFTRLKTAIAATSLFALFFGLPILEGNIANAENFMILPILGAGFLIWRVSTLSKEKSKKIPLLAAGFLLSIAFLTKTIAVFDFASFFIFLLFLQSWEKPILSLRRAVSETTPLFLGFALPILFTALYFYVKGVFGDFISATLLQSIDYVSYGNEFIIEQGFLITKLLLLGLFVITLFWNRKLFSKTQIFIMLWIAFSLFNAFFAQRPFTHYLLVLLPSFILLTALIIEEKKHTFIIIALCLFIIAIIPKNFWIYTNITPYYQNFFDFIASKKTIEDYRSFFDKNVPRDYEVAQFIRIHTSDEEGVFIWGDSAQIYVLSGKLPPGRLAVSYHATFYPDAFQETIRAIDKNKPKYIVVLSENGQYEQLIKSYSLSFVLSKGAIVYERKF